MANMQAHISSFGSPPLPLPDPRPAGRIALQGLSKPAPSSTPSISVPPQAAADVRAVVPPPLPAPVLLPESPGKAPSLGSITSSPTATPSYNGWSQAPVVLGVALGVVVLMALVLLGCLVLHRRRQWKRRNLDIPSASETETLMSRRSMDSNILPKEGKRFDLENPAPVYLGKGQGRPIFPHLKTLHLLSRTASNASTSSSTSTLRNGSNSDKRVYSTQPPIPSVAIIYDHPRTSLPDGFESYAYALRSPQLIDGKPAKRLSLVSNISTIRFARDSHGWALRRGSDASLDHATVFDDDQNKENSPPLLSTPASSRNSRRASQKPRKMPPPLPQLYVPAASSYGRYEGSIEDIQYQPTPLAPPPAQIRVRTMTPTDFVVRRNASIESANALVGGAMKSAPKEHNQLAPSTRPGNSILHSAVAKGKISRQEAESILGMRLAITP